MNTERKPRILVVDDDAEVRHVTVSFLEGFGYDETEAPDGAAALDLLTRERFDLVLGSVGFDAKGDVTAQGYVLYVWRDGKFTPAGKP